ncbi:fatty acyl-CoA reductase 1-like [Aricia agestis]|uniref:fatty acyl-CoA reductase 1-like n=1 Tax=Aricia agestis TaxID=91739 RepID=UPI001C208D81|nr:fatty acyl-CoA reductase 1-like [Aricia agestis]
MSFLHDRDFSALPSIPEYFKGKTVFLTGGSGFIGKVLIEKLLRCCPDIDAIYVLMRGKGDSSPEKRKEEIYKLECFDVLRVKKPGIFESKVFIIPGDVTEYNLGMSDDDYALVVNKTNIFVHSAASVRFNDNLKIAAKLNLLGTKHALDLAKEMRNLESFIHVSTAYSNKIQNPLQETLYPPVLDWRELLEMCQLDDHTIQVLTPKIIDELPNTYVITKHCAEQMVYEERGNLPIVIARPSIVINSVKEPVPGWNDNFNGPVGIIVALATGLSSILYVDPEVRSDYAPVDLVTRAIISVAWARGTKKFEPSDDIPIYNMCGGGYFNLTPVDLYEHSKQPLVEMPLADVILPPSFKFTNSKLVFTFEVLWSRLFLYALIDYIFVLASKKPRLLKLLRRLYMACISLEKFSCKNWSFRIDNVRELSSKLKPEDVDEFKYAIENIDLDKYMHTSVYGARKYVIRQRTDNSEELRTKQFRLKIFVMGLKMVLFAFLMWFVITSNTTQKFLSKISDELLVFV